MIEKYNQKIVIFFVSCMIVLSSCKKDKDEFVLRQPKTVEDSSKFFIYDVMKEFYYWNDLVPEEDIYQYESPEEVLENLKYKELDRFSFVGSLSETMRLFEEGYTCGFGFFPMWYEENPGQYEFYVAQVVEDSPAYNAGIRRGDRIDKMNGIGRYEGEHFLNPLINNNENIELQLLTREGNTKTVSISQAEFYLEPIVHSSVINTGVKVGYVVYDSFLPYTENAIMNVLADFKAEGVEKLIFDLRYNTGGSIDLMEKIANTIAPSGLGGQVMYTVVYNDDINRFYGETVTFEDVASNMNIQQIIFIISEMTYSASEALIENLKPYSNVLTVGANTGGKPVGMGGFSYRDYLFYPVMFATYNADGKGDYFDGITANLKARDGLNRAFGDPLETSLRRVLDYLNYGYKSNDQNDITRKTKPVVPLEGIDVLDKIF